MRRTKRSIGTLAAALLAVGMMVVPAAADEHAEVAVNVTFICQAPEDGTALAFDGVEEREVAVEQGDYVWRVGDERDAERWSDGVDTVAYEFFIDSTSFGSGEIAPGEAQFQVHSTGGAASLTVDESFDNVLGGTATSGDQACEMVQTEPEPEPDLKDACKNGGFEEQGFRNQGQCIASVQANDNARPFN